MSEEFRYRLRIIDADVDGTLKATYALSKIKGISLSLGNAILKKAGINPNKRAGFLTETGHRFVGRDNKGPSIARFAKLAFEQTKRRGNRKGWTFDQRWARSED